jgi:hypothetical protein
MTTGCNGGWLTDPRAYFFADVIRRIEGEPAPDWKQVLESLPGQGMGVNPKPGQIQPQNAPFYGLTVMIDAGGNARGRIWLPTNTPVMHDGNAWYTREIQVIADGPTPGTMVWAWIDKGGAQYAPHVCDSSTPPPEPQPEPDTDHEERIQALEDRVKVLTAQGLVLIARVEAVEQTVQQQHDQIQRLIGVVSKAALKGDAVEVRVGRNLGHGHAASGTIL